MGGHSAHEVKQHVRTYLKVFGGLMALTVVTVGLAYFRLSPFWAILLAMIVACTKGGLVAAYFMHLIGERKIIYWCLAITIVFFLVLMVVPILTNIDQVEAPVVP